MEWKIDSGATSHMINSDQELKNQQPKEVQILAADKQIIKSKSMGDFEFSLGDTKISIRDILYVPELSRTLISVAQLTDHGYGIYFDKSGVEIISSKSGEVAAKGKRKENLFYLSEFGNTTPKSQSNFWSFFEAHANASYSITSSSQEDSFVWHARLGHLSYSTMQKLNQFVRGVPSLSSTNAVCEACQQGKQHRDAFPKEADFRAKKVLELIHTDLCGPITPNSLGGSRFFMLIIDDYSRMTWVYLLKSKANTFTRFQEWCTEVENQVNHKVKTLRSDNGKEFANSQFDTFCKKKGSTLR